MKLVRNGSLLVFAAVVLVLLTSFAASAQDIPLKNWTVPAYSPAGGRTALTDIGAGPILFVPATPCRLVDTRGASFPAATHPPTLVAGVAQNWTVTGFCGIPTGAAAVSANFTATNTSGAGFLKVYPQGGAAPTVSTLNYLAGQTVANAAIAPLGSGGISVIAGVSGTDMIMDVNGYYIGGGGSGITPGEAVEIRGNTDPSKFGLLFSQNSSTRAGDENVASVRGFISSSPNGTGVAGVQASGTGANFGVRGENSSTDNDSAGVLGYSVARTAGVAGIFFRTGVRGESDTGNGIIGLINPGSVNFAVAGFVYNTSGTQLAAGRLGYASGPIGVSYTGGLGGSGTKNFFEPHPTDPTKMIRYASLEGPEAGTYFRGRGRFVNRTAVIDVPESFRMVTDGEGLTVQITPIGRAAAVGVVSMDLNQIVAESTRDLEFSYLVQGVRRAYKNIEVITRNFHFVPESPEAKMPASYSPDEQRRLIENGTYNPDGTVNMQTAERVGWAQIWRDQEKARQDASTRTAQAAKPGN